MPARTSPGPKRPSRVRELEARLARAEKSIQALREVGMALGSTLDLDQLLELILRKITELLDADRATLYLLDERRKKLVSRIVIGDETRSIELDIGVGIAGVVAKTGKTIRVRDAYRDRRFQREWDEITGYRTRSILAVPMKNHVGRTIGVIQVLNKKSEEPVPESPAEFSQYDEELLSSLATQAAVSIDNSRLFLSVIHKNMQLVETKEQLEHRVADLKLLFDLESAMGRAGTVEELAWAVSKEAARACEASAAGLAIDEQDAGVWLYLLDVREGARSTQPKDVTRIPLRRGEGALGYAMLTGEAVSLPSRTPSSGGPTVPSLAKESRGKVGEALLTPLLSLIAVPLEGEDGAPLGAMALYNSRKAGGFTQDDRALLRLVSANASTAVRLFRSRVERERSERLTAIGRLLSSVMHDMKTPLTVISGYMQLMAGADDADTRNEYGRLVLKQFDVITAMQREVLEFARGERSVLMRRVYISKFFTDIEAQLAQEVAGTQVKLVMQIEDRGTARFDETKMTRVIHNLARNAIEAMPKGGTLTIRCRRDKNDLVITFSDTGTGIPKEIEGRLFQSFVSAGKVSGTGLGLAIVKKIIDEHGGTVTAESSDKGATFTVRLPVEPAPGKAEKEALVRP